jgi:hypothetical protein
LWHYTCYHGRRGIGKEGVLLSIAARFGGVPGVPAEVRRNLELIWLTNLDVPHADALGLTRRVIRCDRTRYRYRVTDPAAAAPWMDVRADYPPEFVTTLEGVAGVMPRHWWVATQPVPVRYAPREAAA